MQLAGKRSLDATTEEVDPTMPTAKVVLHANPALHPNLIIRRVKQVTKLKHALAREKVHYAREHGAVDLVSVEPAQGAAFVERFRARGVSVELKEYLPQLCPNCCQIPPNRDCFVCYQMRVTTALGDGDFYDYSFPDAGDTSLSGADGDFSDHYLSELSDAVDWSAEVDQKRKRAVDAAQRAHRRRVLIVVGLVLLAIGLLSIPIVATLRS